MYGSMKRIGRIRLLKMIITIPLLVIILVYACCYYRLINGTRNRKFEIKDFSKCNYNFIINNNLAQYSTYIIKSENKYLIEANVLFNFKHIIEPGKLENYLGIMKIIDLHYYHEIEEVIQLNAKRKYNYQNEYTSKIIFEFSPTDFLSFKIN